MDNPWKGLPVTEKEFNEDRQNFILDCDRDAVNKLNKKGLELNRKAEEKRKQGKKGAEKDFRIQTLLPPEPFAGRIDAPVVILMKMPQYTPDLDDELFRNEDFAKDLKLVREQEGDNVVDIEYPFYHLNPYYNNVLSGKANNPGYSFWEPRMHELIAAKSKNENDDEALKVISQNILLLQAFPYKTNQSITVQVDSVKLYTMLLLQEALCRRALIVVLSATAFWRKKLAKNFFSFRKELVVYKNMRNRYCTDLSVDNIGKEGFNRILERIPSV